MSQFRTRQPVVHIPTFREYKISLQFLKEQYHNINVEFPFPDSDYHYYHTDIEGWSKILPDLIINSNLYKPDKFDCEDFALKAQVVCSERYGLNTLRYTYGTINGGAHGFNTFWTGDCFLIFEPNENYGESVFEIGMNGYEPRSVLL